MVHPLYLPFLKQSVAFLYYEKLSPNQNSLDKVEAGTCFFVGSKDDRSFAEYIVTAKHVYKQMLDFNEGELLLRVNTFHGEPHYEPLPSEGWIPHPNPEVDLVVLPWIPQMDYPVAGMMAFPIEGLANAARVAYSAGRMWPPQELDPVFFLGLLVNYPGRAGNFPVFRSGHIAINTEEEIPLKSGKSRYRIIESQVYHGNSGSPVFAYYEEPLTKKDAYERLRKPLEYQPTWCFLGVLSVGFESEVQNVKEQTEEGVKQTTYKMFGISAVVPGEYLVEMIMQLEEERKRRREEGVDQGSRPDGKEVIEKQDQASS